MFHPSTLRARCHPRFGSGERFVFTLEDNEGNMHVSCTLFENREEREERMNVQVLENNNSNVSLTKLLILSQNLLLIKSKYGIT